ncbi:MAG: UTP--glucose-1-phosphate uridylyltransferase [Phycisphaerales bacterium]|nr:UTP--glucose-1-phosphate uridylyltransferase [Phycisphaerales bacterium]
MSYEAELAYADLAAKLNRLGQSHVFTFWPHLTPTQQADFAKQLNSLDWDLIANLAETVVKHPQKFELKGKVEPAPYYPNIPADAAMRQKYAAAFKRGEDLLRQGKVAAFVVAGGQGTRLGWDGPKGTFPATAIQKKSLFLCFAEFLLALGKRYNHPGGGIPFYIMTSPQNDAATRDFWKKHNYFGMSPADLMFFPQDQMPALSPTGKVLLESKNSLALSPNGHGGSLLALHKSGALADMKKRGITQISYFQVDNPIVRCIDPLFIGLHDLDNAQMSSKMLPKTFPKEKLGNFAIIDHKLTVIEYSDLPDDLAEQRLPNGELRFRSGSIALHAIRRDFVESLNQMGERGRGGHGFALPFHRAEKKVPCIDLDTAALIDPQKPNAVKLETFVFDALPLTTQSIIYETNRLDEFAPIKGPTGIDSAETSPKVTTQRNADWLEQAGIPIPRNPDNTPNCTIEIAPSFALYPADIPAKKSKTKIPPIPPGGKLYLP